MSFKLGVSLPYSRNELVAHSSKPDSYQPTSGVLSDHRVSRQILAATKGGFMRKTAFLLTAFAATGCIAVVGNTTKATVSDAPLSSVMEGRVTVQPGSEVWGPAPASLPAGAQMYVLEGDPTSSGPFTMRIRFPRNFIVPPHYHTAVEHITVISGRMHLGMGETINMSSATLLSPGSFSMMPPGMRHFAHTLEETVLQVNGNGPWRIVYVNSNDDPRNK
jgi:quercetin dioxygenase-like cupin family protein